MPPRISETATRAKLIDPLLTEAGWNLKDRTQVDFEIPVDGYDKEPWNGITDYCLFHPSGEVPLARRGTTTSDVKLMHRSLLRHATWATAGQERLSNCYLILDRMPSISSLRKARMVSVLTFPNELTLQAKAVMVSSSGASNKTTSS
jgi:hypothetical protein